MEYKRNRKMSIKKWERFIDKFGYIVYFLCYLMYFDTLVVEMYFYLIPLILSYLYIVFVHGDSKKFFSYDTVLTYCCFYLITLSIVYAIAWYKDDEYIEICPLISTHTSRTDKITFLFQNNEFKRSYSLKDYPDLQHTKSEERFSNYNVKVYTKRGILGVYLLSGLSVDKKSKQ